MKKTLNPKVNILRETLRRRLKFVLIQGSLKSAEYLNLRRPVLSLQTVNHMEMFSDPRLRVVPVTWPWISSLWEEAWRSIERQENLLLILFSVEGVKAVLSGNSLQVRWQRALPSTELQFTMIVIMHQNVSLNQENKSTTATSIYNMHFMERDCIALHCFALLNCAFIKESSQWIWPSCKALKSEKPCLLCSISKVSTGDITPAAETLPWYKISPILVYRSLFASKLFKEKVFMQ